MPSVAEAFEKFKSRLEPSQSEQDDAIRRRDDVKETIQDGFSLNRAFLTGSYKRFTKTKPLNDIDLFCVLNKDDEGHYLKKSSGVLLNDFGTKLSKTYGSSNVRVGDKNVTVFFDQSGNKEDEKILSIDVVPAFEEGKAYKIPDRYHAAGWMNTDPEIHAEVATKANAKMDGKWVTLVKMAKKWNEQQGKPIQPSFLIEVMALKLIVPPFSGGYKYEVKSLLANLALHLNESWPDPAGYGPPVSDEMNSYKVSQAVKKLEEACRHIDQAMLLEKQGNTGGALLIWRDKIFGDRFAVS